MITNPKNEFERSFGPYPDGHCFEIESCSSLKKINDKAKKGEGVKIAEFLLLESIDDKATISIIEAKASAPQDPEQLINEVQEKLSNSLSLFLAIYLQRHSGSYSELSNDFKLVNISDVNFILILAIQNYDKAWLPPLQQKLKNALKKTIRIWNIDLNSVIVLNEAGARRRGLISTLPTTQVTQ